MAEEWGTVIFRTTKEIADSFMEAKISIALEDISKKCKPNLENLEARNLDIDDPELKSDYICFSFDGSDWLDISQSIVKSGENIEWYARISDEYGCMYFYALNSAGDKIGFPIETGGDYCEIEGYEEESRKKIENWKSKIPESVKSDFPDFVDTDDIDFDGP